MSELRPLVSVVIPAYNAAPYIRDVIESVLAQTYPNIEIVVVDDGSTDRTKVVLEPYIQRGSIIYFHQKNRGLSNTRNTAIRHSHGEFVALLDSDDLFLPTKIERQVGYLLEHPDYDVCYCDVWHFRNAEPDRLLKLNYTYYSGDAVFPNLLKKNFILPLGVVIRRSAIDRVGFFDETYRRSEDWEYWVRLAYHGSKFHFLPEILGKCRIHPGSLSHGWPAKAEEKETTVRIFETLRGEMSSKERRQFHMGIVLLRHRLKLWYVYLGNYFSPLRWFHQWLQKNRLKAS